MGYEDEPGLAAVDGLLRAVFEHARQLEHVSTAVFDRFLRGASELPEMDPTPEGVLRAFGSITAEGGVMPAAALDAMIATPIAAGAGWSDEVRNEFLAPAERSCRSRARDPRPHVCSSVPTGSDRSDAAPSATLPSLSGRRTCSSPRRRRCCSTIGQDPLVAGRRGGHRPRRPLWVRSCTTSVRGGGRSRGGRYARCRETLDNIWYPADGGPRAVPGGRTPAAVGHGDASRPEDENLVLGVATITT
jgi:hypothetical protein